MYRLCWAACVVMFAWKVEAVKYGIQKGISSYKRLTGWTEGQNGAPLQICVRIKWEKIWICFRCWSFCHIGPSSPSFGECTGDHVYCCRGTTYTYFTYTIRVIGNLYSPLFNISTLLWTSINFLSYVSSHTKKVLLFFFLEFSPFSWFFEKSRVALLKKYNLILIWI